jgi:hypothetical protein
VIGGVDDQPDPFRLNPQHVVVEVHGSRIELVEFRNVRHIEGVLLIAVEATDERNGRHQMLLAEMRIAVERLVGKREIHTRNAVGLTQNPEC